MRVPVKNVGFDRVTMAEAVETGKKLLSQPGGHYVVTPNPEIVWLAQERADFMEALNAADLVVPDGIGVIYAAKILGTPLKERVPGFELATHLIHYASEAGLGVYLLGAKPGVAERAAENLKQAHPGLIVCGTGDGYFKEDGPVLERIRASGARLVLVCLGFPKQELWMKAHQNEVGQALMLGVGGSMDVFAGDVKRAPDFWCRIGLEWFYRLMKQPSRIGRMMKLPVFLLSVIGDRLKHGKQKLPEETKAAENAPEADKAYKKAVRKEMRQRIAALDEKELAKSDEAIYNNVSALPELREAETVFLYLSVGHEVDTRKLIDSLVRAGKQVALPVSLPEGEMYFARYSPDTMQDGTVVPIPEPDASAPRLEPKDGDVILVPGLSYDREGYRLGQGGGYYDRFLGSHDLVSVGLARDALLMERVPREAHDKGVTCLVTETQVLRFPG